MPYVSQGNTPEVCCGTIRYLKLCAHYYSTPLPQGIRGFMSLACLFASFETQIYGNEANQGIRSKANLEVKFYLLSALDEQLSLRQTSFASKI